MRNDPDDPDIRPEYDFKLAERGKYASRLREAASPGREPVGHVRSWAPLVDMPWAGSEQRIGDDTWIRGRGAYAGYSSPEASRYLSEEERERCQDADHWLSIDLPIHGGLSSAAAVNSFLIALWIVAPTRTHVPFRFDEAESERVVTRLLERFQWIEGQARDQIDDDHLQSAARLLMPLRAVYVDGQRLRNALVLTFHGCLSRSWQVALTCFTTAAEAMLSDAPHPGSTERLAKNFACLTASDKVGREVARQRFERLSAIRSEVVHGRPLRAGTELNLKVLTEVSDMLRQLWRAILVSSEARGALEGDAEQRHRFFMTVA